MTNNFDLNDYDLDYDLNDLDYDFIDQDVTIRPPDPVKREILIESYNNNNNYYDNYIPDEFDQELDKIIQISQNEADKRKEDDEKREADKRKEDDKRFKIVAILNNIKEKLIKIKGHDTSNSIIYDTIISNINLYEMNVSILALDHNKYIETNNLIKSIRFSKEELDLLQELIIQSIITR